MDLKLFVAVLLSASLQALVSDCLHYYITPALDNQFSKFEITSSIPSDGINGSQQIQAALLFNTLNRRYITFNFKGKGHIQLQFFNLWSTNHTKVEIGGGINHNEVNIYDRFGTKINSTTLVDITSESEYRAFYIGFIWNTPYWGHRVYVGIGSDPRTNHVLYADFCGPPMMRNVHRISISTTSDCIGEWQFASAGQMFGGCYSNTDCSNSSVDIECHTDDESKQTGLIGTCTPKLDDFSTVTFGNGTFRKGVVAVSSLSIRVR